MRQAGGRDKGSVSNTHLVVGLVALSQAAQDGNSVLNRRFTDKDLLETTLQSWVLLNMLAVLVEGSGTDHSQLATGQHRLEHIASVHCSLSGSPGADDGVQLVDEGNDLPLGLLDLVEDGLEALLKLAAVFSPGNHGGQIQRDDATPFERVGNVPGDDALSQPLDDGSLADPRFTDKDRVVLSASRQHLDDAANLLVTTNDGVELAGTGALGEIDGVLGESRFASLGLLGGDTTVSTTFIEGRREGVGLEAEPCQAVLDVGGNRRQRNKKMLGSDEGIAHGLGTVLRVGDDSGEGPGQLRLSY